MIVTVIVPVVAITLRLHNVECIVLPESTSIVIVGAPVKMKFPPVADRNDVDDCIVIVAVAVELKIMLCPGVVIELPDAEMRFVPVSAPVIVRAVLEEVIVDDTMVMLSVVNVDRNAILSLAVAVKTVAESRVMPTLVAVD